MFNEDALAGLVAVEHASDLGKGDMGLVDDGQEFTLKIIQEGGRFFAGVASAQVSGIIFNSGTESDFLKHLHIVQGSHLDPLCLQQFSIRLEPADAILHFLQDGADGAFNPVVGHHEMGCRRDDHMLQCALGVAADNIKGLGALQKIAEEIQADSLCGVGGKDIHRVAPHPEGSRLGGVIVPGVLDVDQFLQDFVAIHGIPDACLDDHLAVIVG